MKLLPNISSPQDLKKMSSSELSLLALELREFLIDNISKTGGHLASNLGVVELTIALHYVFESPKDSFIWDVGHQSYVHKILTGRKDKFAKLRQKEGLSGFPDPKESEHDVIHTGHSSTSISLGVGIGTAKKSQADTSATIAIIGDGSFTGGMVYEALNDASWRNIPLLIILNDNKMSISENVGGIAQHLNILRSNRKYLSLKKEITGFLAKSKLGCALYDILFSIKSRIKNLFYKRHNMFDNLGIKYLGPFDGHNLNQLISLFKQVKNLTEPILLHIITEKGRGCPRSEEDPINFHGITVKKSSDQNKINQKSWSQIFGENMCRLAEKNKDLIAITAAMKEGTGLLSFSQKYPEQFIDVGIAEQHAVSCAVGLAIKNKKPIVAMYSTFLQRAYDQLLHDVCIGKYGVIFCLDRAGFVPSDGKTHQGIFDISYLRSMPNMTIMSPLVEEEFEKMLDFALKINTPVAIRYPKDIAPEYDIALPPLILGEGAELIPGDDGVIVIFGSLFSEALSLQQELLKSQKVYALYHLRFAKPISVCVFEYLARKRKIIILEEGISFGGIGEHIKNQLYHHSVSILVKNVKDEFPGLDSRESLLKEYGFAVDSLLEEVLKL